MFCHPSTLPTLGCYWSFKKSVHIGSDCTHWKIYCSNMLARDGLQWRENKIIIPEDPVCEVVCIQKYVLILCIMVMRTHAADMMERKDGMKT